MANWESKRAQWDENTKDALDDACQTLIDLARHNPSGDCWALIRASDAATGEKFQIAVRKTCRNKNKKL